MKLSEMSTRQAVACMAELAVPVANIVKHPALKEWYEAHKKENADMTALLSLLPVLLRECYDDMAVIIAALTGKTKAELDAQPMKTTIEDVKGCIDQDLISFFT